MRISWWRVVVGLGLTVAVASGIGFYVDTYTEAAGVGPLVSFVCAIPGGVMTGLWCME